MRTPRARPATIRQDTGNLGPPTCLRRAINPVELPASSLRNRLCKVASVPWLAQQTADTQGGTINRRVPPFWQMSHEWSSPWQPMQIRNTQLSVKLTSAHCRELGRLYNGPHRAVTALAILIA